VPGVVSALFPSLLESDVTYRQLFVTGSRKLLIKKANQSSNQRAN